MRSSLLRSDYVVNESSTDNAVDDADNVFGDLLHFVGLSDLINRCGGISTYTDWDWYGLVWN